MQGLSEYMGMKSSSESLKHAGVPLLKLSLRHRFGRRFVLFGAILAVTSTASALKSVKTTPPPTDASSQFLSKLETLQNPKLVITPEQDHTSLLEAFDGAKKSIFVGIFGISSTPITNALVAAVQRGVAVKVICDRYCSSSPKREALVETLKLGGVEVVTGSTGFSISHWKMFVIDKRMAFISTMNFIKRSNEMRDIGVFVTNPSIVAEILAVFTGDLLNAKESLANTPALNQANLVWSPVNSETKLAALMNSADKTIEIWIENLGNRRVHAALKAAVLRGVKVRVLTSQCGMGANPGAPYANLKDLSDSGVQVRGMPFPATTTAPYIHGKSVNVDHQTLFIGSENFSANSLLKARELGIIFRDTQIEALMASVFEKDWNNATLFPKVPVTACEALSYVDLSTD